MCRITVKRSKDYSKLLDNVIENELDTKPSNNKSLWTAMGNELEIQGIEKTQISAIMRQDIEDTLYKKQFKKFMPKKDYHWHDKSFLLIMQQNGWYHKK